MNNQTTNIQTVGGLPLDSPDEGVIKLDKFSYVEEARKAFTNDLSHDKLLSGLYFILDAFERSGIQFFLIRQTAKDAMKDIFNPLKGDHLYIGVRLNEWANDQKDILFPYFAQEHVEIIKQEPTFLDCVWQDIPFTIHLYEDNPCITALIPIAYQYESWNVPNMFEKFEKEYDC